MFFAQNSLITKFSIVTSVATLIASSILHDPIGRIRRQLYIKQAVYTINNILESYAAKDLFILTNLLLAY